MAAEASPIAAQTATENIPPATSLTIPHDTDSQMDLDEPEPTPVPDQPQSHIPDDWLISLINTYVDQLNYPAKNVQRYVPYNASTVERRTAARGANAHYSSTLPAEATRKKSKGTNTLAEHKARRERKLD